MDQKDELILSLKNEGKSLREIGRQVGMSHVAVKKRLDRLLDEDGNQKPETFQTRTIYVKAVNRAGKVVMKKVERTWDMGMRLGDIDNVIRRLKEMVKNELPEFKRNWPGDLDDELEDKDIFFITDNGWRIESVNR